ncbi:MAG: hypothetical protein ACOX8W_03630 [bacterium]
MAILAFLLTAINFPSYQFINVTSLRLCSFCLKTRLKPEHFQALFFLCRGLHYFRVGSFQPEPLPLLAFSIGHLTDFPLALLVKEKLSSFQRLQPSPSLTTDRVLILLFKY